MIIWLYVMLLLAVTCYILLKPKYPQTLPPMFEINVNIDKSFKPQERLIIFNALTEWEKATHGLVKYYINNKEAEFLLYNTDGDNSLNLVRIHSNHRNIVKYKQEYFEEYGRNVCPLGLAWNKQDTRIIYLIYDKLDGEDLKLSQKEIWRRIILHEIGHTLGLDHIEKRGTVMYPYVTNMSHDITPDDVSQFIFNIRNYLAQGQK